MSADFVMVTAAFLTVALEPADAAGGADLRGWEDLLSHLAELLSHLMAAGRLFFLQFGKQLDSETGQGKKQG